MAYKLKSGKHVRFEEGKAIRYVAGDIFEPTNVDKQLLGERLEAVDDVQPATIVSDAPNAEFGPDSAQEMLESTPTEALKVTDLESVPGIDAVSLKALKNAGIMTLTDLARVASGPELAAINGIGKNRAAKIRGALLTLVEQES